MGHNLLGCVARAVCNPRKHATHIDSSGENLRWAHRLQAYAPKSIAEIFEIRGNAKVAAAHELNHSLEFIFLFPGDPNLSVLQLALHLEAL